MKAEELCCASLLKDFIKVASRYVTLLIDDNEVFLKQFVPVVETGGDMEVIALSSPGKLLRYWRGAP